MPKIRNPNYTPPADDVKPREAALKTFVESYDETVEFIDFDEIQAQLPAKDRNKATQGRVHQFATDNGFEVVLDD